VSQTTEKDGKYDIVTYENGDKEWYLNGKLHREHDPAVMCVNGDKKWYLNGRLHREEGPAIFCYNGDSFWYLNNKLHREDGPAVELIDGTKSWWLCGKRLTEEQYTTHIKFDRTIIKVQNFYKWLGSIDPKDYDDESMQVVYNLKKKMDKDFPTLEEDAKESTREIENGLAALSADDNED
jgi:hypothetical protein